MAKRDRQQAVQKLRDRIAGKKRLEEIQARLTQLRPTSKGAVAMTTKETRRFEELCAKIITEKDDKKFNEAVRELNAICDNKGGRLREPSPRADDRTA